MAMAHWEIQGWMILILGWVFVPFYTRSMVYTMPEFLEKRFNPQSRTILATISLISYVLTKVAVTVYAGGLVFQQVFGIDELWGIDFFWDEAPEPARPIRCSEPILDAKIDAPMAIQVASLPPRK